MDAERLARAQELFQEAYQLQVEGEFDTAVSLYKQSLETYPTAEAHTFLGWTYRNQGKLEEAIAECKRAIEVDPRFGNPYNDIGVYLMELGKPDQALEWLEKAIASERYQSRHYPWYNLGRIYAGKDYYAKARECFRQALELAPGYVPAAQALDRLRRLIQ